MKETIKKLIISAIEKLYPDQKNVVFSVDYPPAGIEADLASNAAMILAKKVEKRPMVVAEELAKEMQRPINRQTTVSIVEPGFLNFRVRNEFLLKNLSEINRNLDKYGASDIGKKKLAIVEYFQLNVAKPPHVGHLRSAVIGDSLKRIMNFLGYKTVSDTHIGDWGTQFGFLLLAYKKLGGKDRVKHNPFEELNQLYIEINKMWEEQKSRLLRDDEDSYWRLGMEEFKKLEHGHKESRRLWKWMVGVSNKKFVEMVKLLKLEKFDYDLGESFYQDKMPAVLKKLEKAGLLVTGETGEKYVNLEPYGLGRLICVKSDGATTYELRDLATLAYRYDELAKKEKAKLAWNLYIVDSRQAHDFKQVFKTMELLGYDVSKSKHVEFGFMSLPEGAFSTRKGNVISLESFIQEAKSRALKIIKEKNSDLKDKEKIAEQVALAAIKYGDLKHNRRSDIVFVWDTALSFEGNTGPYLQYTHARLKSILRKEGKAALKVSSGELNIQEEQVLRKLIRFPDVVKAAAIQFLPSEIANYLYEFAGNINNFYQMVPVLQEKNEKIRATRLAIVAASAAVLKKGLELLGIDAPEEM